MKKKRLKDYPELKRIIGKGLSIMKLSLILMVVGVLQSTASVYSQNWRMSMNEESIVVKDVLAKIENSSEFRFFYEEKKVNVEKRVDVEITDATIEDIMNLLFNNEGVEYKVLDSNFIVLKPKGDSSSPTINSSQQKKSVTGKVTDSSGATLPGVSVVVKGTTTGVITDNNGMYYLSNLPENATLQFSFVGMKMQEIAIDGKTTINITLVEETVGIEEVVAIGYGTMIRKDVTGSISTIASEKIETRPIASAESALQGLTPGLNIADRNSRPGELGSVSIRSMGSISAGYEPLWVIDGFPTDQRNAAAINPADIASIDILKDASSTAIYGSRAANGVIIITTKSPLEGRSSFNVSITSGVSSIPKSAMPEILNSEQYVKFYTEKNKGITPSWISNYWDGSTDTDWRNELYQTAFFQNYSIAASGGNKKVNYLMSAGYINQEGVIPGEGSIKYSARMKINYHPIDKVTIGLNMAPNLTSIKLTSPNPQSPGNSFANIGGSSVIDLAEMLPPILPVRRSDGSFAQGIDIVGSNINSQNPLEVIRNYERTEDLFRMLGGLSLAFEPINGLIFNSSLSTNIGTDEVESVYYAPEGPRRGDMPAESVLSVGQNQTRGWLNENTITFKKKIKENHSLNLLAGFTLQNDQSRFLTSRVSGLPVSGVKVLSVGNSATLTSQNGLSENSLVSYLGRVNYSYKDRYLFTGTLRNDGSSRFGTNNRFKTFGSFALAWRLTEEEFIKKLQIVDNAKMRFSYGTTGSNKIPNYIARPSFIPKQWSFGGVIRNAIDIGDPGNPNLTWETSNQLDLGLDLALFKNRFNLVFDFYNNLTSSLLLSKNVIESSGFLNYLTNIGSMRNRGAELTLNVSIIDKKDFKWTLGGNVTNNQQEILDLGGVEEIQYFFGAVRQFVGGEMGNIHLVKEVGIFREGDNAPAQPKAIPGDLIYEDVNGDGVISNYLGPDGQNLDGTNLEWVYGINSSLRYKNFELSALFNGQAGESIFDRQLFNGEDLNLNIYKEKWYDGRYISETQPGDGKTPRAGGRLGQRTISTMIQKTDFLRLKNITLTYMLPKSLNSKTGLADARIFFSVENVHTWTNYIGGNPDGRGQSRGGPTGGARINGVDDSRELGVAEFANLPLPRMWTLGINFSF